MVKRIHIGVIGLGRIGWGFHCAQIALHKQFRLAAVADPLEARRKEAEAAYGCASFAEAEDLLDMKGLDAVAIASPTHLHREHALRAFRNGLDVLLEKPMAMDLAQARDIVREAKKRKRVLTVYQPHRCAAYYQQLKKLVASGKIGEVYHVETGRFRYVQRDDWQALTKFGGGMLNNYGAHALDQILDLTGRDVKRVFGQLRRVASLGDAEDVVKVVYETKSGTLGEVNINQASASTPYELIVWGTLGTITLSGSVYHMTCVKGGRLPKKKLDVSLASAGRRYPSDKITFVEKDVPVDKKHGIDFYRNFADALNGKSELLVKPEETLAVMEVMAAARKSAGRIIDRPRANA